MSHPTLSCLTLISQSDDPTPVFGGKHTMPDGLAGFYSDGDIPQDSTLCDNPVNRGEGSSEFGAARGRSHIT